MATRKKVQKKTRTKYPDEYQAEAVRLAESIGTTAAARELGIQTSQIYGWRNKQRVQASTTEIENRLLAENAKLKREVAEQKEELSLLKGVSVLREEPEVKYAFIKQNECNVPVTKQCKWLCVSTSGYYDWQARQSKPPKRSERQSVIDEAIAIAFKDRRERYGSPRLTINLNEAGFPIAENTVAASMRRQGLVAKAGRKFKATTNSKHKLPVMPNLLEQDFSCSAINEKWCGDITYLWTDEGWMYLAMVLDLFSRRVIGWSLSHRMTAHLACDAMQMAISNRGNTDGTIMHTDRGSQYCSKKFQRLLKANGIRSSMSKKGDCYDNACAESFFHSLKVEAIHGETIETRDKMRKVIFDYIELDYNTQRHHSTINNTSPVQFELENAA